MTHGIRCKRQRISVFISNMRKYWVLYVLFVPVVAYYVLFHYKPMIGVIIAFKNYNFVDGILGSEWVGLRHFVRFMGNGEFWRIFRNTVQLAALRILVTFPAPILLALMFNEVRSQRYKRVLQTISYLPHFVSFVIVYAVLYNFFSYDGFVNSMRAAMGLDRVLFFASTK